ncbi:hypothetical protein EG68_07614 [Paragonimus skrjabini miyazakii]|uniref:Uncharacterized protein n=1 Tax=Paragonimus skrjabini miyazakii TaxID=59628 RepID=A0A8S9YRT3_9TREM|nr:hypothetical protein EG68_07614 [Paragonimus skrjabini miyazakii]
MDHIGQVSDTESPGVEQQSTIYSSSTRCIVLNRLSSVRSIPQIDSMTRHQYPGTSHVSIKQNIQRWIQKTRQRCACDGTAEGPDSQ